MTDLIVIGAGPAGMSAATFAANAGVDVLLLDEQPRPGGQIYRNITRNRDLLPHLGSDYSAGFSLAEDLKRSGARCLYGASVWYVGDGPEVAYSIDGKCHVAKAPHVLLATGAQERPVPFPGWTLPGVMPVGAAQILMKSADMIPQNAILAGCGPLLYLVATQMIEAGTPPLALVETQSRTNLLGALPRLPKALRAVGQLAKGVSLMNKIRRAGVSRFSGATGFRAEANDGGLTFYFTAKGEHHSLSCDLLLTHQGIIPSTHLSRTAGAAHEWHSGQACWHPAHNGTGRTSQQGLWVAGDGAGILGAEAAKAQGIIAAQGILKALGHPQTQPARLQQAQKTLSKARALRGFLDAAYPAAPDIRNPPDETILCRCEEITAGQVRAAADAGAAGLRQVKTATRAGMGPCQGRMCDLSVTTTLAAHTGTPPAKFGPHRARSPSRPVSLGELSELELED